MAREDLNDIVAFLAVAREKNFTKAAVHRESRTGMAPARRDP
jgi:hypothetical protein